MGKIRETKYRIHKSATVKSDSGKVLERKASSENIELPLVLSDNPFSSVTIDLNKLNKSKPDLDTCSISGKSNRELKKDEQHLTKKERIKRRHDRFLEKMDWDQESVLEFLDLYENEPVIWNMSHPKHKGRHHIHDAWKRIENKMENIYTVPELKKKKDSLMASFRACRRKVIDSLKSDSVKTRIYIPNWFAFDKMASFLLDKHLTAENMNMEMKDIKEQYDETEDGFEETDFPPNSPQSDKLEIRYESKKKKKPKKPKKNEVDMAPLLVSLPDVTSTTKPVKPKIPVARQSMKAKKRLKHDLSDIKHFRNVLDDSVFRKNPAVAIKEFLLQKIAEKRPDLQLKPDN